MQYINVRVSVAFMVNWLKICLKNQFATNARFLLVQQPQENSWVNLLVAIFLYLFFFVDMHL